MINSEDLKELGFFKNDNDENMFHYMDCFVNRYVLIYDQTTSYMPYSLYKNVDEEKMFLKRFKTIEGIKNFIDALDYRENPVAEEIWNRNWKHILIKEGIFDLQQLKKELADFTNILSEARNVYSHITGNTLSSCTYKSKTVIEQTERHYRDHYLDLIKTELLKGLTEDNVITEDQQIKILAELENYI
jgi:hypothetical protein